MAATTETGQAPRRQTDLDSGILQRQVRTHALLDRRNFLGLAATATVATAIGLSMCPTITLEPGDVARPELETDADAGVSPRRPRQRPMRQSAVAPD